MKKIIGLIFILLFVCVGSVSAVDTEVVATVGSKTVTNIDVFKEATANRVKYLSPNAMKGVLERILDPILFEEYAERKGLKVTDQEVMADLEQDAHQNGLTTEQYFKKKWGKNDKNVKDWQVYKAFKKAKQVRKLVEHFSPDYANVTEGDIQSFVGYYKSRFFFPLGDPEGIRCKSISCLVDPNNRDERLKELENIRERLNKGENFEKIADEYADKEGFGASKELSPLWRTSEFRKKGLDALVPWKSLNGKAVIVTWGDNDSAAILLKIEDYTPDTRMNIEDAAKDKEMRKVVIERTKGYKFMNARGRLLATLRAEDVNYAGSKEGVYRKLAEDYETWWVENYQDTPDFQQNFERLQQSKLKYQKRHKKKVK